MREYLIKRIIVSLIIIYIIATLQFIIFQVLSPVNPVDMYMFSDPRFKPEMREMVERTFGFDQPMHVRYLKYLGNMFTWNFGYSFQSLQPVSSEMSWRLANSVLLLGTALVCTIMIGVPIGTLAASRRGTKVDVLAICSGIFTGGVPTFFIQLIALMLLSYYTYLWWGFSLFPGSGIATVPPPTEPLRYMADVAWHMVLPVGTLVVAGFGGWALFTRNTMLDSLTQDYILTARAKGISERTVLYKHALRSTLPPVATLIALSIPGVVVGAIITEFIFSWPGIGQWYIAGLLNGDYPVVQAVFFIYSVLIVTANIVADLLYGVLDPRIRVGVRR